MAVDRVRRAFWRDVWRRVVRPKGVLDWAESVALILFPIGLVWIALGRERAMEEVITTALYMTAAAVVAGVFLVLRLANAAADIHTESLASIALIEGQRDAALSITKARESRSITQTIFPRFPFANEQNHYWYPDSPETETPWSDTGEKDVEVDWPNIPDDVEVTAQVNGHVRDRARNKPEQQFPGYGLFRVVNSTDAIVAVASGQIPESDKLQNLSLRIPRSSAAKAYRLEMKSCGESTMVSVTGEIVLKRRS